MSDVVDGTVVEEPARIVGRELQRVTHEVLVPLDIEAQRNAMRLYQDGLQWILDDSDWQDAGRGERFVKKSGWRKIAAWFNVSIELLRDSVERDEKGTILRAAVWARAVAPNGRHADADGYCDVGESRFARNKAKLENDLRGTASTRAINRAISNLVGMGAVSHEEMVPVDAGPPFGPVVNEAQGGQLRRAISYVLDESASSVAIDGVIDGVVAGIQAKGGGYVPLVAMQAVGLLAAAVKGQRETTTARQSDEGAGLTSEGVAQPSKQGGPDAHLSTDDELIDAALREREATP